LYEDNWGLLPNNALLSFIFARLRSINRKATPIDWMRCLANKLIIGENVMR
jgi:hypothetical protein